MVTKVPLTMLQQEVPINFEIVDSTLVVTFSWGSTKTIDFSKILALASGAADFYLQTISPDGQMEQGQTANVPVQVIYAQGFNKDVKLTVLGGPPGMSFTFANTTVGPTGGGSKLSTHAIGSGNTASGTPATGYQT